MTSTVDLAAVRDYLGASADQWEDDTLTAALATETRAQLDKCCVPAGTVEPLDEAICRRVARNLALRKLPLGLAAGELETARVPSNDPEIRRLEAPYRRRPLA